MKTLLGVFLFHEAFRKMNLHYQEKLREIK